MGAVQFALSEFGSDIDVKRLARSISLAIEEYQARGEKLSDLDELTGISITNISKAKSEWRKEGHSIHRTNKTLRAFLEYYINDHSKRGIFHEILDKDHDFLEEQAKVRGNIEDTDSCDQDSNYYSIVNYAYRTAYEMLRVKDHNVEFLKLRFVGKYVLFRRASIPDAMVFSVIEVREREGSKKIIEYMHYKIDGYGRPSFGDGIVIPKDNIIYMVSDIEDGLGLEFISLRIPTSKKNDFFEGHIFTLDGYGEPVNARCGVLSLDKFNEIIDKSVQKEFSLDFSLGHTKQSVDNVALIGTKTLTELKGQSKLIELIERMAMHERVQNEKNLVPQ